MTGVLYAVGKFCVKRRFVVLAVWFVAAVALVAISHQLGDNTNDNLKLPGTDSQRATDTLAKSFPAQANGTSPIVFHVSSGKLTDSKYANAINQAAADTAKTAHVASVVNPLTPEGASALSKNQATGYMSVTTSVSPGSLSVEDAQKIVDAAKGPTEKVGIEVQTGGVLGTKISKPATESSELIGILAAMFILTFTFGTVVAMLIPIVTAIFSLITTLSIIRLLEHVVTVPTVAPTLATMIGLGVGIDYALFIVTRHFRGMQRRPRRRRVGRTGGGDVRRCGVLRRRHGDDCARVARRRRDPDRHNDGTDGGGRRRRRRVWRADSASGDARDPRPADQRAEGARSPSGGARQEGAVGEVGP